MVIMGTRVSDFYHLLDSPLVSKMIHKIKTILILLFKLDVTTVNVLKLNVTVMTVKKILIRKD